jgi:hypothetical protein
MTACFSRLALAIAVLAVPLTSHAQEQEPVYGLSDAAATPPELIELNPNFHESPYFETWDFWMWTDDGTVMLVQFLSSSFGFGIEKQGSGRLIVISPDATNIGDDPDGVHFADRGWAWDDGWGWTEEPLDITWRDCYLRGDGQTFELFLRGRDRTTYLEATLNLEEPLHRPGDGRLEYGWEKHFFYEQIAMPRFSFTARLNRKSHRDDEDNWEDVSGVGYGEHTLTNNFPFEIASRFIGFRALRNDGLTIIADGLTTPADYGGRGINWGMISLDGERILESAEATIVPIDEVPIDGSGNTYMVPHGLQVQLEDGEDWARINVYGAELVSATSPFARVGAFLRAMLGALMAPYDFEATAEYEAWIHVDGHTAYVSGRGWLTTTFTE